VRGELRDAIQRALQVATEGPRRSPTDLQYLALRPGEELVDRDRPGFLARANQRGVRLMYRYRDPGTGKQSEHQIGYLENPDTKTGNITLAAARGEWAQLRARRLDGKPLLEQDQQLTPETPALPTVSSLVELYMRDYAEKVKRPRSAAEDGRLLHKHVVSECGRLTADKFTPEVAAKVLGALNDRPVEQRKLRAALSTLFNVAIGKTKKMVFANTWLPRAFANPVATVQAVAHEADVRAPSVEEMRRYVANLQTCTAIREDYRDALLLQALFASRIREVVEMRWDEVDLAGGCWVLPSERSKNKQPHEVYLTPKALEILERRAQWKAENDIYVFPAPGDRKRPLRVDLTQKALSTNRKLLGVGEDYTTHMARHALSTWAAEQGFLVAVVDRVTGHVTAQGINKRYNKARLNNPARDLWTAWAAALLS